MGEEEEQTAVKTKDYTAAHHSPGNFCNEQQEQHFASRAREYLLAFDVGGLGFEFCVFVASWSEWLYYYYCYCYYY